MPRKLSKSETWPTLVLERLGMWGRCIRAQRLQQRITAADLCRRLGISEASLRRLEHGDPGASAGAYLSALLTLGVADAATPLLPAALWQESQRHRVKLSQQEKGQGTDADYF
jgi:transcriptional regulator with XRE-family HTH domain